MSGNDFAPLIIVLISGILAHSFFELVEKGEPFEALDYACPTPEWAVFGSNEAGFSPDDVSPFRVPRKYFPSSAEDFHEQTRWHRKKKDTAAPVADS